MKISAKLRDLIALRQAIICARREMIRMRDNRKWRTHRVRQCIVTIRRCSRTIVDSLREIVTLRSVDNMNASIDAMDVRIEKLRMQILHAAKIAQLEKLRAMQAQIRALNDELPEEFQENDIF